MDARKFLIFSDLHGSELGVDFLMYAIKKENPDLIICLGDILHGGYYEGKAASKLETLKDKIIYVLGNCDYQEEDSYQLHAELPLERDFEYNGRKIHLMHRPPFGSYPPGDIVMHGHTHVKRLEKVDGVIYFNPGSISYPRDDTIGYGILEKNVIYLYNARNNKLISKLNI